MNTYRESSLAKSSIHTSSLTTLQPTASTPNTLLKQQPQEAPITSQLPNSYSTFKTTGSSLLETL